MHLGYFNFNEPAQRQVFVTDHFTSCGWKITVSGSIAEGRAAYVIYRKGTDPQERLRPSHIGIRDSVEGADVAGMFNPDLSRTCPPVPCTAVFSHLKRLQI